MKREIIFRGKRVEDGELVYGSLTESADACYISIKDTLSTDQWAFTYEVDPNTVSQYTGIKDTNGKKIYEGDKMYHPDFPSLTILKIRINEGCTFLEGWDCVRTDLSKGRIVES